MSTNEFEDYQEACFDAFCKKVIRNAATDIKRKLAKQRDRELDMDDELYNYLLNMETEDRYSTYVKLYSVKGMHIKITNERIGEALQYIMPNKRAVLLLSYFMDYSDTQIAKTLGISNNTVAYRKKVGLAKLRKILEEHPYA